jgi:hypothetical protein
MNLDEELVCIKGLLLVILEGGLFYIWSFIFVE